MTDLLAQPLTLPCGVTLPNRLAKSALTEGLADPQPSRAPPTGTRGCTAAGPKAAPAC